MTLLLSDNKLSKTTLFDELYKGVDCENGSLVLCETFASGIKTFCDFAPEDMEAILEPGTYKFFRVSLMRNVEKGKQGGKANVSVVPSFHLDVDCGKPGYCNREDVLSLLKGLDKPPSEIVNSDGQDGGFHCYWILDVPFVLSENVDEQKRQYDDMQSRQDGIQRYLRSRLEELECSPNPKDGKRIYLDPGQAVCRLLRIPGTKRDSGNLVSIEHRSGRRYKLEDFEPATDKRDAPCQDVVSCQDSAPTTCSPSGSTCGGSTDAVDRWNKSPEAAAKLVAIMTAQGHVVTRKADYWEYKHSASQSENPITGTIGKLKSNSGKLLVTSFSPNCVFGNQPRGISLQQALADLEHGGDLKAATSEIHDLEPVDEFAANIDTSVFINSSDQKNEHVESSDNSSGDKSNGVPFAESAASKKRRDRERYNSLISYLATNPDEPKTDAEQELLEQFIADRPKIYTGREIGHNTYLREWLVEGLLVEGQSCVVAGPSKSLKTNVSVALAVALMSAGDFLNEFRVKKKVRVLFMSAESGEAAIQSSLKRIMENAGTSWQDLYDNFLMAPWVPHAKDAERLFWFREALGKHKPDVVFIDPVYMATDGEDSANLQKMGQQFATLTEAATKAGATSIFVHHAKKNALNVQQSQPLEMSDMQGAGVAEHFRQWMLLARRERYDPAIPGDHKMWISGGGSNGHSYEHALDINERNVDGEGPTGWSATLSSSHAAKEASDQLRNNNRDAKNFEKKRDATRAIRREMTDGEVATRTRIQDFANCGKNEPTKLAIQDLEDAGVLEKVKCVQTQTKFRQATDEEIAAAEAEKKGAKKLRDGFKFNGDEWLRFKEREFAQDVDPLVQNVLAKI